MTDRRVAESEERLLTIQTKYIDRIDKLNKFSLFSGYSNARTFLKLEEIIYSHFWLVDIFRK